MTHRPTASPIVALVIALAAVATLSTFADSTAQWRDGYAALSELGDGFVIWESDRSGRWRLYSRQLDGTGFRQISPDEPGRDHFCPHVSPDGRRVVYVSYPAGRNTYKPFGPEVHTPLYVMNVDGTGVKQIAANARGYGEDRAAVWLNDDELVYVGGDRMTYRLNLQTGKQTPMLAKPARGDKWTYGYLVDPTLRHATSGRPEFAPYDAKARQFASRKPHGGCQPYFTRDGKWGFWMGGAGGPVNRIDMASGSVSPILAKNDRSLPRDRSYIYFPMISPCQRLIAFAASPNQHDHFKSDYDIFVATIDPQTLERTGKPVRFSFDSGCDRFPDVYVSDMPLGRHAGEAPLTVSFTAETREPWQWSFGDGRTGRGAAVEHTFDKPGQYKVTAQGGDRVLKGVVSVSPAKPPELTHAVAIDRHTISAAFTEAVNIRSMRLTLASGNTATRHELSEDGRSLTVHLARDMADSDTLTVAGVTDLAQRPNAMPDTRVTVTRPTWPVDREGLVYLWQSAEAPNLVDDGQGHQQSYPTTPCGTAIINSQFAMVLGGGAFTVQGADERLLAACRRSNELTVEAIVHTANLNQRGPARIISFSENPSSRNFTLGQEGDQLVFRLRTPRTGENGTSPQVTIGKLPADRSVHVIITYKPGRMMGYIDGEQTLNTNAVHGDFGNWSSQQLLFGDEVTGDRDWSGELKGIAIYSRAIDSTTIEQHARFAAARIASRQSPPMHAVKAKLIEQSQVPTLAKIAPYRQALMVSEYELTTPMPGVAKGKRVRVAEWAILDGQTLPVAQAKRGQTTDLVLQSLDANPQLKAVYVSDTLPLDLDANLYYDLTP